MGKRESEKIALAEVDKGLRRRLDDRVKAGVSTCLKNSSPDTEISVSATQDMPKQGNVLNVIRQRQQHWMFLLFGSDTATMLYMKKLDEELLAAGLLKPNGSPAETFFWPCRFLGERTGFRSDTYIVRCLPKTILSSELIVRVFHLFMPDDVLLINETYDIVPVSIGYGNALVDLFNTVCLSGELPADQLIKGPGIMEDYD